MYSSSLGKTSVQDQSSAEHIVRFYVPPNCPKSMKTREACKHTGPSNEQINRMSVSNPCTQMAALAVLKSHVTTRLVSPGLLEAHEAWVTMRPFFRNALEDSQLPNHAFLMYSVLHGLLFEDHVTFAKGGRNTQHQIRTIHVTRTGWIENCLQKRRQKIV